MADSNSIKVIIDFKDGTREEFYADGSYDVTGNGRIVYWNDEDTIISYPVDTIKKIVEK